MTVQFRSRIKPAIDYSTILNSYGVCCGITGATGEPKSFIECFNEGGHYIPVTNGITDTPVCPDTDIRRGCCCACSYVTPGELKSIPTFDGGYVVTPYLSSGTRSNVSKCECNRLGGQWQEGACPTLTNTELSPDYWQTYCVKQNEDVRAPRACCHLEFDDTTGWPVGIACEDVCTSTDCALLGTDVYPSVFTVNKRCGIPPLNSGDNPIVCASNEFVTKMAFASSLYEGFNMGSCYELELVNGVYEYTCAITPNAICTGYWVAEQDEETPYCTTSYRPTNPVKTDKIYGVQRMTVADFNLLGLTPGDEFHGGVYIGTFKPSARNGKSSTVYGNINFGLPESGRFVADAIGTQEDSQWAIIVDTSRYNVPFLVEDEADIDFATSLWDGYYNTYGNGKFKGIATALAKTIKDQPRKGFIDYYLPSIYELNFYAQYLINNQVDFRGNIISSSIFNTKYLNSRTSKSKIKNKTFVYGQAILDFYDNKYRNILINKKNVEVAVFFRRIVLE